MGSEAAPRGATSGSGGISARLSRRRAAGLIGGLVGVSGAAAAACGPAPGVPRGSAPEGAGAAPGGQAQTTITYWASWTGAFEEMVKRIANAFMAKNPDVRVNHLVIPGSEMDAKILTGVAADDPPDVAMIWGAQRVYSLADQGALAPLEDALDSSQLARFRDFVHPPIWELGRYKDKVYAIPQWVQSYCHIWNQDFVQQAGLNADTGPRTTEELFDWATKLTRRGSGGSIDVLGYYSSWMQLNMAIFGGSFYDEKSDAVTLDTQQNLETLNYIVRYTKEYDPKKLADYQAATSGAAQGTLDPLLAGRTAMILEGPWELGVIKETKPDFKYGVAPVAVKSGRTRGWWTYGDIPCIIRNTKQTATAARYVTFLTGFGGEEEYASLYLMPPKGGGRPHNPISRKLTESAAWQPVLAEYPGYEKYMATAFGSDTQFVLNPPKMPIAAYLFSQLESQVSRATLGLTSPEQALAEAQKQVTDEYTRFKRQQGNT
jgi:multiple sugar transport system substrate-binding protein